MPSFTRRCSPESKRLRKSSSPITSSTPRVRSSSMAFGSVLGKPRELTLEFLNAFLSLSISLFDALDDLHRGIRYKFFIVELDFGLRFKCACFLELTHKTLPLRVHVHKPFEREVHLRRSDNRRGAIARFNLLGGNRERLHACQTVNYHFLFVEHLRRFLTHERYNN